MTSREPTSALLARLLTDRDSGGLTTAVLIARLGDRSFGLSLMILGFVAVLPGVSAIAGFAIVILAAQMVANRASPLLPRRLADRTISRRGIVRLVRWSSPVLRLLERIARPRWPVPARVARRLVGAMTAMLGVMLFTPIPLSNVPPALAIVLLAVAYVEGDGLLLALALLTALILLSVVVGTAWEGLSRLGWVGGIL